MSDFVYDSTLSSRSDTLRTLWNLRFNRDFITRVN